MNLIAETQKLQNYLKIKDYKTVVNGCEKLIRKFPNNPFLFNLLGLALHGAGKYLIAIDRYKKSLDLDLNFLPAMNNIANSYKAIGNFEKAENYYEKVIIIHNNIKFISIKSSGIILYSYYISCDTRW